MSNVIPMFILLTVNPYQYTCGLCGAKIAERKACGIRATNKEGTPTPKNYYYHTLCIKPEIT